MQKLFKYIVYALLALFVVSLIALPFILYYVSGDKNLFFGGLAASLFVGALFAVFGGLIYWVKDQPLLPEGGSFLTDMWGGPVSIIARQKEDDPILQKYKEAAKKQGILPEYYANHIFASFVLGIVFFSFGCFLFYGSGLADKVKTMFSFLTVSNRQVLDILKINSEINIAETAIIVFSFPLFYFLGNYISDFYFRWKSKKKLLEQ